MTTLLTLPAPWDSLSPWVLEGACLAANANPRPVTPETWLAALWETVPEKSIVEQVSNHFQAQFAAIQRCEYQWPIADDASHLQDLASGFLAVWQVVESNWVDLPLTDAMTSVIGNVHLGMYLAVDEMGTIEQMEQSGVTELPNVDTLLAGLSMWVPELVMIADELYQGSKASVVNPYKSVGRNDPCPCGSSKKFKQCCGSR
uniref:YecA/YgfB family protein n=1 Tax=Thaumasiovibrio occultus TaxID=1891184 RepID=UPI000B354A63|nr:SEC-C metal-binding domain-containing protein [Thaumasiovibrio occultus]